MQDFPERFLLVDVRDPLALGRMSPICADMLTMCCDDDGSQPEKVIDLAQQ